MYGYFYYCFAKRNRNSFGNIFEIQLKYYKHLNLLAFKQAFTIYMENNKEDRDTVKPIIDSIKDNMNKLRTDFGMPNNHQVLVTEG